MPTASPYPGFDYPMRNNISYPFVVQWLLLTSGHTAQRRLVGDDTFWAELFGRWMRSGLAFDQLDRVAGNPSPVFQEWLEHPQRDAYWDSFNKEHWSTDAIRARYREGLRTPRLIRTREALRYDFEHFNFVSRSIRQGHRLRLVVSPVGRVIESPFAEKNYNGGGPVAAESAADGRAVTVTLYHDRAHPSALRIPLGRGPPQRGCAEANPNRVNC